MHARTFQVSHFLCQLFQLNSVFLFPRECTACPNSAECVFHGFVNSLDEHLLYFLLTLNVGGFFWLIGFFQVDSFSLSDLHYSVLTLCRSLITTLLETLPLPCKRREATAGSRCSPAQRRRSVYWCPHTFQQKRNMMVANRIMRTQQTNQMKEGLRRGS